MGRSTPTSFIILDDQSVKILKRLKIKAMMVAKKFPESNAIWQLISMVGRKPFTLRQQTFLNTTA
ncbi:hypothetical protein SC12_13495 [Lactiplantibacillus plantarum]|nr:hypothetical protein SC12_13495 [Lactiplantibacillus plantarum]